MSHSSISVAKAFSAQCNALRNTFLLLLGSSTATCRRIDSSELTGSLQTSASFEIGCAVLASAGRCRSGVFLELVFLSAPGLSAGGGAAAKERAVWGY